MENVIDREKPISVQRDKKNGPLRLLIAGSGPFGCFRSCIMDCVLEAIASYPCAAARAGMLPR